MRIDIHTHWEFDSKKYASEKDFDKVERDFLNEMNRAKMDYTVLLPIDMEIKQFNERLRWAHFKRKFREAYEYELENSELDSSFEEYIRENREWFKMNWTNELVKKLCSRNPDRFIGFGSVNPCRGEKVIEEKIDEFVKQGFKGIKLIPTFQFFNPAEPRLDPIYQKAMENNLVVLIHTGCDPGAWDYPPFSEDANPEHIYFVASHYPDLKIVAAHMGSYWGYEPGIWFEEMMEVMFQRENIYTDIAALRKRDLFGRTKLLERAIKSLGGVERILFGSDHPVVERYPMHTAARTIDESDIKGKEKIMGENARKLLGL